MSEFQNNVLSDARLPKPVLRVNGTLEQCQKNLSLLLATSCKCGTTDYTDGVNKFKWEDWKCTKCKNMKKWKCICGEWRIKDGIFTHSCEREEMRKRRQSDARQRFKEQNERVKRYVEIACLTLGGQIK